MKLSRVSHCHSLIAKCGANGFPWKTLYRDSTGYSIRCCSSDCYAFRMMRNYFNSTFGKARRILGLTGAFMLLPFTLLLPLLPAGLGLALTANVNVLGGIIKRSVFEYITWFIIYYLFLNINAKCMSLFGEEEEGCLGTPGDSFPHNYISNYNGACDVTEELKPHGCQPRFPRP